MRFFLVLKLVADGLMMAMASVDGASHGPAAASQRSSQLSVCALTTVTGRLSELCIVNLGSSTMIMTPYMIILIVIVL